MLVIFSDILDCPLDPLVWREHSVHPVLHCSLRQPGVCHHPARTGSGRGVMVRPGRQHTHDCVRQAHPGGDQLQQRPHGTAERRHGLPLDSRLPSKVGQVSIWRYFESFAITLQY